MSPPAKWDGVERRRYALRNHAEDLPEERRRVRLTDEDRADIIAQIKVELKASIFEDIGRWSVSEVLIKGLTNLFWLCGIVLVALVTWLAAKGYIKL
jgi:hypothetical protein